MSREKSRRTGRSHALGADQRPSECVYTLVADLEHCSPLDLPPLADATDPDALDRLLTRHPETTRVSFAYCGYDVTATAGEIWVRADE